MKKILVVLITVLLILVSGFATEILTDSEINGILLMREEEKLARDTYLKLYELWGLNSFSNIARSEQKHMDQVGGLLNVYGIDDPVKAENGEFLNETLQILYNQLVEKGSQSLVDAIKVGMEIEELDIKDLEDLLIDTENPDLELVYKNLIKGSENHLRAYNSQLQKFSNDIYVYKYITTERAKEILSGKNGNRGK